MKKKETIAAVLGEDILKLLIAINKYDSLLEGKLLCYKCGKQVDENNLFVIIPKTKTEFEFICNDPGCFGSFVKSEKT